MSQMSQLHAALCEKYGTCRKCGLDPATCLDLCDHCEAAAYAAWEAAGCPVDPTSPLTAPVPPVDLDTPIPYRVVHFPALRAELNAYQPARQRQVDDYPPEWDDEPPELVGPIEPTADQVAFELLTLAALEDLDQDPRFGPLLALARGWQDSLPF